MRPVANQTNTMTYQKLLGIIFVFTALLCISSVYSGVVTKCKSDDSKCARESAQALLPTFAAGLAEYQVKPLDPLTFKKIDASSPNLNLTLTDIIITGLKECIPKKVKRDKDNSKLFLKFLCSCQLDGKYEMNGQLLILPIQGNGPTHVTLRKALISVDIDLGVIKKDGDTYWDVKGWTHSYDLKDKSTVIFENLFDGNEVLAKVAKDLIAQSGNEIILEVGPPVIKAAVSEVVSNVKAFFNKVPERELSLD